MALRRQVKNVVRNFSDIEVKVRECTSNDPWGPSSSLTSELADATYNVQAFSEIMIMLWKRINDHGKNWRHVYKSLVVLDYIVKTGSERVAQQCRENIFAIKTLKDFQFIDKDGKDQGVNVREKSKQLVALLKDDERLKAERERALKAKERFTESQGGIGNTSYPRNKRFNAAPKYSGSRGSVDDSSIPSKTWTKPSEVAEDSKSTDGRIDSEMEKVRPSNETEEELQLQIALAMSREEAEREQTSNADVIKHAVDKSNADSSSTLLNLTSSNQVKTDPWSSTSVTTQPHLDPWSVPSPKQEVYSQPGQTDPWGPTSSSVPPSVDPWSSASTVKPELPINDPWSAPSQSNVFSQPISIQDPFMPHQPMQETPFASPPILDSTSDISTRKSPSFLTNGAHLVDVNNILSSTSTSKSHNPFMANTPSNTNPFAQEKAKPKSINELRNDKSNFVTQGPGDVLLPMPIQPSTNSQPNNPFLL